MAALGARYAEYRKRVPMLVPGLRKRDADVETDIMLA
jgi:hypothetical protein